MKVRARVDVALAARVVSRQTLVYSRGADLALDRPPHLRAASAMVAIGANRFAIVQDDANFLAFIDVRSGEVHDIPFPVEDGARLFDDRRGNKKRKLDLEATIALSDGTIVAFGSGSTDVRERVVLVRDEVVRVVHAQALYAAMRGTAAFSGSELNVEGAVLVGDDVLFLQRGNGRVGAVDATARVEARALVAYLREGAACPSLRDVVEWDLGASPKSVRLTFTDGAATSDGIAFLACAEDCPDATRDGPVDAVAIGRLDDRAKTCSLALVYAEDGALLTEKAEGLAFDANRRGAWIVIDKDDPDAPSQLLRLDLGPGWAEGSF